MKELTDPNLKLLLDELSGIYQMTLHIGTGDIFPSEGEGFPREIPGTVEECVQRFDEAHVAQVERTNQTLDRVRKLIELLQPIQTERIMFEPDPKGIREGRIDSLRALVSLQEMRYKVISEDAELSRKDEGITLLNYAGGTWLNLVPEGHKIQIIETGGFTYEAVLDGSGRWMREI